MKEKLKVFSAAFPHTVPVLTGFTVLGIAYGILMNSKGYPLLWIIFISTFVYAGSIQFIAVSLLTTGFQPLNIFLITIMVNARHLFYGISMLSKFKSTGKMKPYLIFGLSDETFSILCSAEPPEGIDKNWFMFFITLLNHLYWILGSALGGILGTLIKFNTKGIDFVLTALFVVLLINQWKATKKHILAFIGIGSSLLCRIIFGPSNFIIPSMLVILILLIVLRNQIEMGNET